MENEIVKYFITQGPFGLLFVWLLLYVMKANKEREKDLNGIIQQQNNVLSKFSEKYDLIISELRELKERFK
ncbi:BhlA/UviB family holin-like peptide [Paenibacillus macerans]|uniref:BhlA/UviB family holin-like peptide n=1 Tax=Paenibacillus macerans TaxID=44252 RepID=UPI0020424872|nr:BhlA/UviB family holin-like peptide [Paenibacillus macerans]MCM3701415.1 BhlA/UviB family holin-like peptide [Paenibacillus macerans]